MFAVIGVQLFKVGKKKYKQKWKESLEIQSLIRDVRVVQVTIPKNFFSIIRI